MARAKYKKRSDGRYLVQIQTGFDENGKQKFKNIYAKTIPELEKKINTFKYNLNRGIVVDDQNLTFKEWANNWLDTYKTNVTTRTRKRYKSIIDIQLKPLHNIKLSKLKTVNIQKTINELTTSVSLTIKILKQIIKQAMINELIFKDLMLGVSFSTQEPKKRRQLNEQEREAIEKADFSAKERTFVYLCLYAGLRRGEALALKRNDVDFKNDGIRIHRKGGKEVVVYFGDEVESALLSYIEERKKTEAVAGHEEALFLSLQKKRISVRAVEKLVKKYAQTVTTVKHITPHKLRSTYGTNLYRETGDIYLVADVLGHNDVNTTKKHYAALEDDRRRGARNAVKLRD